MGNSTAMKSFCQDQTVLQKFLHYLRFETEIEETGWNIIFLNYYLLFQVLVVAFTAFLHWYQLVVWHFSNINIIQPSYKVRLKIIVPFFKLFSAKLVWTSMMVASMLRTTLVSIRFGNEAKIIFSGSVRFKDVL